MTQLEQQAVDEAFQVYIQGLFKVVVSSLTSNDEDSAVLKRYKAGLELGVRAYRLVRKESGV